MAVGGIGNRMGLSGVQRIDYRTLWVASQQGGVGAGTLTLRLGQQMVVVLDDAALHGTLNFTGQAAVAVEAPDSGLRGRCAVDQTVQRIIPVVTQ